MGRGVCVLVWSVGHVAMRRHCRLPRAPGRVTPGGRHETGWRHSDDSLTTLRGVNMTSLRSHGAIHTHTLSPRSKSPFSGGESCGLRIPVATSTLGLCASVSFLCSSPNGQTGYQGVSSRLGWLVLVIL